MGERLRLATGRGPLGTGIFLLGRRALATHEWVARPWVCLLSLPILPLRPARFRGPQAAGPGESWEVEREGPAEAPRGDVARVLGGALGTLVLGLGPGLYAWTAIHQTGLVEAFRVVIGVAAPILVVMWRDLGAPRVLR
jgi:hypothetical protein